MTALGCLTPSQAGAAGLIAAASLKSCLYHLSNHNRRRTWWPGQQMEQKAHREQEKLEQRDLCLFYNLVVIV